MYRKATYGVNGNPTDKIGRAYAASRALLNAGYWERQMSNELFREGGPHKIRKTGPDEYMMNITLPSDSDGRLARECPVDTCSPGYFKVRSGTGITGGQEVAYCPYCRFEGEPSGFTTQEQLRYAQDLALAEAHEGIERMVKDAFGLGPSGKKKIGGGFLSIEMSYKPGSASHVRRPFEEEVRRDVICPHCGLDHSVYGLATWCADCGHDIFLTHVEAELNVVRAMLADVDRRRESLGIRVAAKDLENCLEDTVSIFEAVLRAEVRRHFVARGVTVEDIDQFFKKVGNAFQSVRRAEQIFHDELGIPLLQALSEGEVTALVGTFEKRHPITHNLGVVDKKYIERARTAEREGREIYVNAEEITSAIDCSMRLFSTIHSQMFSEGR